MQYYTAHVTLHIKTEDGNEVITFKDIEGDKLSIFQERVYTVGVKHPLSNGSIQFVNPLSISTVILIPQDRKYSI